MEIQITKIRISDKASDFTLPSNNGKDSTLSQFFGKKNIVLFFYPRDEGPTCVKEAQTFRDKIEDFQNRNTQIIGISAQSVESHKQFAAHHNLPYLLLSDSDNSIRKLYDVKSTLGVPGRATFVINKEGIIKHIFVSQLQYTKHAKEAINALKEIQP